MTAVDQLPNPYQRAALIVARWSGARRDEIRRLAVDCLDEAAKVIQAFFHAGALTGRSLDDVLRWAANPMSASEPAEILLEPPTPRRTGSGCCTARCTVTTAPPAIPSPPSSRQ
jgi:hypothetical protein